MVTKSNSSIPRNLSAAHIAKGTDGRVCKKLEIDFGSIRTHDRQKLPFAAVLGLASRKRRYSKKADTDCHSSHIISLTTRQLSPVGIGTIN